MTMTKIDRSSSGILILCAECPYWHSFRFVMIEAHNSAVAHEARVHPGDTGAAARRANWVRRHAADSRMLEGRATLDGWASSTS